MPDQPPISRVMRLAARAAQWRPASDRQIWLIVAVLVVALCAEALVIPAKRAAVPCAITVIAGLGAWAAGHRRRVDGEDLAARCAAVSRDDIPAEVIVLAELGKKIEAISRYRKLTGVSLRQARAVIGSL